MSDPARDMPSFPAPPVGPPLAALLLDQRQRWQKGDRALVETYLERQPDLHADTELLLDLIYNEFILREQQGETPRLEEYLQRFPRLAEQLRLQFEIDQAVQAGGLLSSPSARSTLRLARAGDTTKMAADLPALPGYQVLELIGRGGMGVVYRARQLGLNRLVALKMLRPGDTDPEQLARFKAEAEAVARLQHPNIVQIHEIGEWRAGGVSPPVPYIALEHVDGGSLDRKLAGTPQPAQQAAELVETLARAVHAAHQQGIVHRDLKPANILLAEIRDQRSEIRKDTLARSAPDHGSLITDHYSPKITDFGLAKRLDVNLGATRTGAIMGTPSYMAPEQAQGRNTDVGPAVDVYALGAILYEMLTGRPPFQGESPLDILQQVLEREPIAPRQLQPKVPRDLETICLKCLQKEPKKRYGSGGELADDLRRFLKGEPIQARPVGQGERFWRWCRRRPAVASLLAVLVVLVTVTIISETWLLIRAERLRRLAETRRQEAEDNLREARDSLQIAREGIDRYLVQVDEDPRLRQGDLMPLRMKMLQDAVPLYERLVRQRYGETPEIRAEQGSAMRRLAHLTQLIGDKEKSRQLFAEAAAIFERLAEEQPEVPRHRSELANCRGDLGVQLVAADQRDEAEQQLGLALAGWEKLIEEYPDELDYQHRQSLLRSNIGALFFKANRLDQAEKEFLQARDLRRKVIDRAPKVMAYQRGLAELSINLGEVYRRQRALAQARDAYQEAVRISELLVQREPSADFQNILAISRTALGELLLQLGPVKRGEEELLAAKKTREEMVDRFGNVTDYQLKLGDLHRKLGDLYRSTDRLALADGEYQSALKVFDRLARQYRNILSYRESLAEVRGVRGDLKIAMNQLDQAEIEYREACAIREELARLRPDDVSFQRGLATSHFQRAYFYSRMNRPADSIANYEEAVKLYERLVERPTGVLSDLRNLGIALFNLALVYPREGRHQDAAKACDRSRVIRERVVLEHPYDLSHLADLGAVYERKAYLIRDQNKDEEALPWLDRAIVTLQGVIAQRPRDSNARGSLLRAHANRAYALTRLGRHGQALPDWDEAIRLDSSPERDILQMNRALTLVRLGEYPRAIQDAGPLAAREKSPSRLHIIAVRVYAQASVAAARDDKLSEAERKELAARYRDLAMDSLRRAVAAGYSNVKSLETDPALDPLRDRDDFKALLEKIKSAPKPTSP